VKTSKPNNGFYYIGQNVNIVKTTQLDKLKIEVNEQVNTIQEALIPLVEIV